jgi:thiol-disulfide isomerase/thioredoxin
MIIVTVLAAIVLVLNIQKVISNNSQTDGIKFKEEYEKLNGKKNNQGKKYREITIDSKNKMVYKTTEEVLNLIGKKKSFVLYFGFDTCPWCRSVVPTLASISKELNQEVYYIDVKDIRDTFELDDDNKPKLVKKGSKDYGKLLEKLEPVLEDYTLTDSDNNDIKVGKKRIYAPSIVSVIDGKAKELTTGISDKQTDGYMKLTKEMEKDTYNKIKKVLKQVSDKNNTCYLDKGC